MVDDLRGRSVLVTGAGGFIGSHLTRALVRSGARVRALCRYNAYEAQGALEWLDPDVRAEVDVVMGDVRDGESVQQAIRGCDAVCHLAAHIGIPYSYANPRAFFERSETGSLRDRGPRLRRHLAAPAPPSEPPASPRIAAALPE